MKYSLLGKTGLKVSRLGLGGAPFGGGFGPVTDESAAEVVHAAIDEGINFVDTAPWYGESERRLGIALQGKRERIILATKCVGRDELYTFQGVVHSVERSLKRLKTEWLDLIQIHNPDFTTFGQIMNEALPALLKLKEEGKIRTIGINGRDLSLLTRYMKTGVFDVIQMYFRYMLIDHTAKDELLPLAKQLNIGIINGSVLGGGLLADTPAAFLQGDSELLRETKIRMDQLQFLRHKEPHGLVEPAMRFSLGCPEITVTLTGALSPEIVKANAGYCDGRGLSQVELNRVYSLFQDMPLFEN